ncbi:MAG TPA: anti-sigma factor [Edaphobacter sp.]|nr:anti-sigma factor [Edaphobacter sp.]
MSIRHIEHDDLALFAMQLLSPEEMQAAAAHIEDCPECRQNLAEIQGNLALYASTVDMEAPRAEARERLLAQVAKEKKPAFVAAAAETELPNRSFGGRALLEEEETAPRRGIGGMIFPWLGWVLAACFLVAAGKLYFQRETMIGTLDEQRSQIAQLTNDATKAREIMDTMTDPTAMHVTLTKTPSEPVTQGRVTYVANKGMLIFEANNMEPLEPNKVYELWLIPASGSDPIPAGTFHPDEHGNASLLMPTLPKEIQAKAFGVTIENEGGSQKPTLPIIMAGV